MNSTDIHTIDNTDAHGTRIYHSAGGKPYQEDRYTPSA